MIDQDILFLAFRYALGRRTYVSLEMSTALIQRWHTLPDHMKGKIIGEIKDAIRMDEAGDPSDIIQWRRVIAHSINQEMYQCHCSCHLRVLQSGEQYHHQEKLPPSSVKPKSSEPTSHAFIT